jgi:hypothetical protein
MYESHPRGAELEAIHNLLQKFWTKAVGSPDYNKREWEELQRLIEELAEPGKEP